MANSHNFSMDDKDLDDVELWKVIDSAAASHSSSRSRKPLALKNTIASPQSSILSFKLLQTPKPTRNSSPNQYIVVEEDSRVSSDGEVLQEDWRNNNQQRPQKIARTNCNSSVYGDENRMVVAKPLQRTPKTPSYFSSPDSGSGKFSLQEISPVSDGSPSYLRQNNENEEMRHSLSGRFPSVSLFKEYQNAAMAILERSDYTMISGNPFIKKSGWRKIAFFFNLSFEIKDKTIEVDENRNVQRAEFVVRAHMQGGRFSDGWGSCERREKRFMKPNNDIPSTAETRAKNKACQDLLGIGEYRSSAANGHR
ncbi:peptide transporter family protein [Thalictrum thalictroides]|uniref:Peptide transporter family protein n=1 Tax=Thalictrum thalictroides TaxID=46969 RepID=A0A7J6VWR5_THATH|nr:peptide transporter family protein [Thalictrum thalictroides]